MVDGIVVDGDGHLLEPADLWTKHLPRQYREDAIQLVWNDAVENYAYVQEQRSVIPQGILNVGLARTSREVRRDLGRGMRYEDLPRAGADPAERLKELDREGIDIAVLYPSLGLYLAGIRNPELAVLSCRVYNDWLAEFCSEDPRRLIGVAAVPLQDPEAAAAEARRAVTQLGMRALFIKPNKYNEIFLHSPQLDAFWAEAQDLGVPVGIHPAGATDAWGAATVYGPLFRDISGMRGFSKAIFFMFDDYVGLSVLVGSGVLERFPRLKVIVLESGGGWLPHWLDSMDHWWEAAPSDAPLKPSEYFLRQCAISCDPDEKSLKFLAGLIGPQRMIWASDYPHHDVTAPSVVAELLENIAGLSEEDQRILLGESAVQIYGLQPARAHEAGRAAGVDAGR